MVKRPNILLIMTDQHHADCLGYTGRRGIKTPHIDKLAAEGVNFTQAYSGHGTCLPSRSCYLTGMYAHAHGIYGNDTDPFPENLLSLGNFLQRYGYQTAIIGKKHLPRWNQAGFQYERLCYHADAPLRQLHYYQYLQNFNLHHWYDYLGDVTKFCLGEEHIPVEHSLENWTADETIKYLEQVAVEPFFLMASFERPHPPLTLPQNITYVYHPEEIVLPENLEYTESSFFFDRNVELLWTLRHYGEKIFRTALAKYYTLITLIDQNIGRIVEYLIRQGLRENTLIIFCADHGDFAGEYGRMAKGYPYDAIIHIPFVWNWPGVFQAGKREDGFAQNIDLFPTICDLLGLPQPESVQGQSLLPALTSTRSTNREAVFFESVCVKSIRTKTHKLNYGFTAEGEIGELFDLTKDPHEYRNVFVNKAYADIRENLLRRLLDWWIETQQPINFSRRDEKFPPTGWFRKNTG
ncbi:MAG: sulfatase-like hydrolase/transferase [Candidatus Omnitrophica bacterium]|nr:sulfatase-like hydrolase/transferase [Candidatus Omnitrophota bacterium]